jgi:uncharacterized protein
MQDQRRDFLRRSLLSCGLFSVGPAASWAQGLMAVPANLKAGGGLQALSRLTSFGPLQDPDANGIRLPAGFRSRVIARSGRAVRGSRYVWHDAPDGGATFAAAGGGWIYVSNAELNGPDGSVSAIVFNAAGKITDAYSICSNSARNCAGGPTPWGTWLTCEEVDRGRVLECDPNGINPPVVRNALGWFDHEAAAVDPNTGFVYLTEDRSDGRLYRFRPQTGGNLSAGILEVAQLSGGGPWTVTWRRLPEPNPTGSGTRTRYQIAGSTAFNGGEGAWHHDGVVYITTKGDNRVWALETGTDRMSVIYDDSTSSNPILTGVDNVTVSSIGEVYVAEDGGNMQVCVIDAAGNVAPVIEVKNQSSSELCGVAFSPNGKRLYFSSQRGTTGSSSDGITYEVKGPFTGA